MKSPKLALIAITLAALLTACSGGGGNTTAPSDSTTGGTDGGTTTTTTDGTTTTLVTTTCTPSPALPSQYSRVFKAVILQAWHSITTLQNVSATTIQV